MTKKEAKARLKEIKKALKRFPEEVRRQERAHREEMKIRKAFSKSPIDLRIQTPKESKAPREEKVHPWRLCPRNQFYRSPHRQAPYIRNGKPVRGSLHPNECVINQTGKDQLYAEEIQKIAELHFGALTDLPTDEVLSKYHRETEFDAFIAGWTKYWNEVLRPTEFLEVNFVKALIATESSFDPNAWNGKKGKRCARGLMQVTNESVALLQWGSKELKDHFVNLKDEDMLDPNLTICAGIRWLFRKREIAESRYKVLTWPKVVMLYKKYRSMNDPEMQRFMRTYDALRSGDKSKLKG